jgi:2,4-dienoyl-CoA reductase-like NADH-dependent reductase (Old Yellow Enzyme family)
MAPMTRAQSDNGVPTQKIADYYGRRAASEVGLILSEGTVINRPGSKICRISRILWNRSFKRLEKRNRYRTSEWR